MQLDKDTLRKLRGLIIFTLVILVGLWRFSIVLQAVKAICTSCSLPAGGRDCICAECADEPHPEAAVCKRKGKAEKFDILRRAEE